MAGVKTWDIFLSHASADSAVAGELAGALRGRGFEVFLAEDHLDAHVGSAQWTKGIDAAIDQSRAIVLLVTPAALESKWVEYEWRSVHNDIVSGRGGMLVPVCWNGPDPGDLERALRERQVVDCRDEGLADNRIARIETLVRGYLRQLESVDTAHQHEGIETVGTEPSTTAQTASPQSVIASESDVSSTSAASSSGLGPGSRIIWAVAGVALVVAIIIWINTEESSTGVSTIAPTAVGVMSSPVQEHTAPERAPTSASTSTLGRTIPSAWILRTKVGVAPQPDDTQPVNQPDRITHCDRGYWSQVGVSKLVGHDWKLTRLLVDGREALAGVCFVEIDTGQSRVFGAVMPDRAQYDTLRTLLEGKLSTPPMAPEFRNVTFTRRIYFIDSTGHVQDF